MHVIVVQDEPQQNYSEGRVIALIGPFETREEAFTHKSTNQIHGTVLPLTPVVGR